MPTGPNEASPNLLHFHVCNHCGTATRREEFEGRALTSGLFLFLKCGLEGPLNVEIREVQESQPSEAISIGLKRAAIALAEQLDYARATEQLNLSSAELRKQVAAFETLLCLRIFKSRQKKVELTDEGRFLIKVFRKAVALHDRKEREGRNEPDSQSTKMV